LELNEYLLDSLTTKASKSWDASRPRLTLSVFGIAVKNHPGSRSQTFYEKTMGFRVAFTFPNAAGQVVNTYYQEGRDSFMEMQLPAAKGHLVFTNAHFVTNDLAGTIARRRQSGLAAATPGAPQMPGTIGEKINVSPGAKTKERERRRSGRHSLGSQRVRRQLAAEEGDRHVEVGLRGAGSLGRDWSPERGPTSGRF
jgi:hypothetical protein